jgi:hypothetical protein
MYLQVSEAFSSMLKMALPYLSERGGPSNKEITSASSAGEYVGDGLFISRNTTFVESVEFKTTLFAEYGLVLSWKYILESWEALVKAISTVLHGRSEEPQ